MVIVWVVVAALLVWVELHHRAFYAIFAAAGAAGAAIVAALRPSAVPLQVLVGAGVAVVGLVGVRPYVSRAFEHNSSGVRIRGVHGGLVGATGVTVDEVGRETGHVRLLGENWLAVTTGPLPIPEATPVVVIDVVGTTLTVQPATDTLEIL